MTDPKRNPDPDYKRPADWPYEEDWGSPAWKAKMAAIDTQRRQKLADYGFSVCPSCNTAHTNLTLTCRNCDYRMVGKDAAGT